MTQDNPASNQTLHKRLSSYYLACLGRSARPEAKFFAKNKYSPEFAELNTSPFLNSVNLTNESDARRVIELSRSKKDKQLFVGQVVFADYLESKSSDWKGFILYPLFITPIESTAGSIDCTDSPIFLNPEALKKILGISSSSELQEAALEIEEELGLGGIDGKVQSMEDVLKTVKSKFEYWNWIEEVSLVQDDEESNVDDVQAKLSEVTKVGLYNRSVVFLSERPKYTLGLETELKSLGSLSPEEIKGSALAHWLGFETSFAAPETEVALIEPIPLNSEQRDAVSRSLSQPLTVITGPPGTGKSQVVSSILINAAMQGTTVLFSSKNNKAVDVVETRVNSLGQRPILLRLGARDLQERLSDYLTRIISMKTEPEDLRTYERAKQEYADLALNLSSLSKQIKEVIQQRNSIDDLDKEIEPVRNILGEELVTAAEKLDIDLLRSSLTKFQTALRKNTPGNQGFIGNIFPSLGKKARQQEFASAITNIREVFKPLGFQISSNSLFEDEDWSSLLRVLSEFMNGLDKVSEYRLNLSRLNSVDDLGVLAGQISHLQTQTAEKSMSLWQAWLRTIPERLTQVDRRDLTKFQSTVTMLSKTVDGKSAASLKSEQQRLFPSVSRFLPCWAVTSLSVRNRVPFSPGFFDLVVIDEASQCDIASALPLLMRAKRAVIIGDPLQLRHVSNIDTSTDRMLLDQNALMEELEWSYSSQSLFDLAAAIREEDSMITLRDHHRSDSQIIEYSNSQFYDGQLRVATKHENLMKPSSNTPAIRWIEVKGTSVRPSQGSVTCSQEAKKLLMKSRD
jgi:hypothetical protein